MFKIMLVTLSSKPGYRRPGQADPPRHASCSTPPKKPMRRRRRQGLCRKRAAFRARTSGCNESWFRAEIRYILRHTFCNKDYDKGADKGYDKGGDKGATRVATGIATKWQCFGSRTRRSGFFTLKWRADLPIVTPLPNEMQI